MLELSGYCSSSGTIFVMLLGYQRCDFWDISACGNTWAACEKLRFDVELDLGRLLTPFLREMWDNINPTLLPLTPLSVFDIGDFQSMLLQTCILIRATDS